MMKMYNHQPKPGEAMSNDTVNTKSVTDEQVAAAAERIYGTAWVTPEQYHKVRATLEVERTESEG